VDGHLLAFEGRRDAADEDHLVDSLELTERGGVVHRLFRSDVDFQISVPCLDVGEVHTDVIALASLHFQYRVGRQCAPGMRLLLALTIDIYLEVAATLHVEGHLAALLGTERGGVAGREILDLHAWGEVVHARCGHSDRLGVVLCGNGFALALGVVPELPFESCCLSVAALVEERVDDLVGREVTSFDIDQFFILSAQSVEDVDGVIGCTVVVAPHHRAVVGVGPDDGDAFMALGVEGQDVTTVFQQHERLSCHVERELRVFLACDHREGDTAPRHQLLVVHLPEVKTSFEQTDHVFVDFFLADESASHSIRHAFVGIVESALHVCACECGACGGMCGVARHLMACPDVTDGTAVAHHEMLESPLVAQDLLEQAVVGAAGLVVETLISAHHLAHIGVLDERFECRQIGFPQITWRDLIEVGGVARALGTAVYGIVLGAGPEFAVTCRLGSLQTSHDSAAHHTCLPRVLAIGLLTTPPPRIAEDVDIGRPHRETVELLHVAAGAEPMVILCPHLVAGGREHAVEQVWIERRGHGDRLGIDGDAPEVGHAMQCLTPPIKLLDAQARDGGTLIEHELRFLVQGQSSAEIHGPLVSRQTGILVGECLSTQGCRAQTANAQYNVF